MPGTLPKRPPSSSFLKGTFDHTHLQIHAPCMFHRFKRKVSRNSPAVARRWLLIPGFFHPGAEKKEIKRDSVSNEDINEGLLQIEQISFMLL